MPPEKPARAPLILKEEFLKPAAYSGPFRKLLDVRRSKGLVGGVGPCELGQLYLP